MSGPLRQSPVFLPLFCSLQSILVPAARDNFLKYSTGHVSPVLKFLRWFPIVFVYQTHLLANP